MGIRINYFEEFAPANVGAGWGGRMEIQGEADVEA